MNHDPRRNAQVFGGVQLITNDTGLVASTSTYKPFGEKRTDSAGIIATETKGFVGERYDSSPGNPPLK